VDPAAELRQAGQAMAKIKTAQADLKFGAGAVAFGFTLVSGTGKVRLPDASDTSVKVRQSETVFEFELVTLAGHNYLKAPLVGWQELTGDRANSLPDLRQLFSTDKGISAIVPSGRKPHLIADEAVDGHDCHKIGATYAADQVASAITVLTPTGDVDATLWVDKGDHRVRRVLLSGKLYDPAKQSTLEVHLHDFDASVDIQKPI
jgi:hypothetical protein